MLSDYENPFGVTKATEFSDKEINEYWVDFSQAEDGSIIAILNPRELLPKYVRGSKGCGKTHFLRYFSFPSQRIRHGDDLIKILEVDKYIGLYSLLNGLNLSRFAGKGIDDGQWQTIFEYYFELYIADRLLEILNEIVTALSVDPNVELQLVTRIRRIFDDDEASGILNLQSLHTYLGNLRRKIDFQIRNVAFTRQLDIDDVRVLFDPGDLIFGIPAAFVEKLPEFKEVTFVYVLDEYEKLFEWQKVFINSLVWEKQVATTFWIGGRRYGFTNLLTKSGEPMRNGSEFQFVDLDLLIRSNRELYDKFALGLFARRLTRFYERTGIGGVDSSSLSKRFLKRFEEYSEEKVIAEVVKKRGAKEYPHFEDFKLKVERAIREGSSFNEEDRKRIDDAIELLKKETNGNPLEQKLKLNFFYAFWYKSSGKRKLIDIAQEVNEHYFAEKLDDAKGVFWGRREKWKKDLLAQLAKENNTKNLEFGGRNGVAKFIELSDSNPRSFINYLKKAIEYATVKGERPLDETGFISLDSQYLAVYDTAKWFYQDVEVLGDEGRNMYQALRNLGNYLAQERFCDKPVETTVSCFYVKANELSGNTLGCIHTMTLHSILFEVDDGRPGKTSGVKERLFQLNKTLAPFWNLPTVVRGQVSLNTRVAEAIFNPEVSREDFEAIFKQRRSQLNAPDFIKRKGNINQEELFS